MAALPAHLIPATRARRFWAGIVNLFFAGAAMTLGSLIADRAFAPEQLSVSARFYSLGLVSALWLLCLIQKKSLGASLGLIEIRTAEGERPRFGQMVLRTSPVYCLAAASTFPDEILPDWLAVVRLTLVFILFVAATASACVAIVTRLSVFDRMSGTMAVQLALPEHMKPRNFGIRIT